MTKVERSNAYLSWGGGFVCSFLFVWLVAPIFTNSTILWEYDEVLGHYVRKPGSVVLERSEGWAETAINKHGLIGHGDAVLAKAGPKFVLWGDSHVEAFQVDDSQKAVSVYNAGAGNGDIKGLAIGESGLSVADYYFDIPKIEHAYSDIVRHVIMLNGMNDVLPCESLSTHSRFAASPWRLEEEHFTPNDIGLQLGPVVSLLRLEFLYDLYRSVREHVFHFDFGEATASVDEQVADRPSPLEMTAGWEFLIQALKKQAKGELVFLYCPMTPQLGGGAVTREDPDRRYKTFFFNICQKNGVGVIDLTHSFLRMYDEQHHLPRGFQNSVMGAGHLNERGHAAIAQMLSDYFRKDGL